MSFCGRVVWVCQSEPMCNQVFLNQFFMILQDICWLLVSAPAYKINHGTRELRISLVSSFTLYTDVSRHYFAGANRRKSENRHGFWHYWCGKDRSHLSSWRMLETSVCWRIIYRCAMAMSCVIGPRIPSTAASRVVVPSYISKYKVSTSRLKEVSHVETHMIRNKWWNQLL